MININEAPYESAVKYFDTIPKDTAEYAAAKVMQKSHDIWKRAATDLIARADKMQSMLDKLSVIPQISSKL